MAAKVVTLFFIVGITAMMSCVSTGTGKKSGTERDHYEDLSIYRSDYKKALDTIYSEKPDQKKEIIANIDPEYDVTSEVNQLLDSITKLKKDVKFIDGYTIQVYTGIKRDEANEAKAKVYTTLEDSRPVITYDQPNFKVKVGKFYTRREALRTFAELKRVLPASIIISEKIPLASDE